MRAIRDGFNRINGSTVLDGGDTMHIKSRLNRTYLHIHWHQPLHTIRAHPISSHDQSLLTSLNSVNLAPTA